jgi:DNA-binding winged helix-turn-helix (wHTH) protein/TolB-like protein/tetratricopeptide (TPR) repeat protein
MDAREADVTFEFGEFRLNRRTGELCRVDTDPPAPLPIGRRALDVLCVLLDRQGQLVTKHELMDAAWAGLTVEENNLTVQISALRRLLDRGAERSCIETIPGRGYRFLLPVRRVAENGADPAEAPAHAGGVVETPGAPAPRIARRHWLGGLAGSAVVLAGAGGLAAFEWGGLTRSKGPPPRLSVAVLPFEAERGDPVLEHYVDVVTETLTTDLASLVCLGYFSPSLVAPHQAAVAQSDKYPDAKAVGAALEVRYVLTGRVRRVPDKLQVSVELVSTETGALLWSERYEDEPEAALAEPRVMARWVRPGLVTQLIHIEAARGQRERPDHPDAIDLVLQGKSWEFQAPSPQRIAKSRECFERALQVDPASVHAMTALANALLLVMWTSGQPPPGGMGRIEKLISDAETLQPNNPEMLWDRALLLWFRGRWLATEAAFQRLYTSYPTYNGAEFMLGRCYLILGKTDHAIRMFQFSIRQSPKHFFIWVRYHALAMALLLVGRPDEAVSWEQRALAAHPENSPSLLAEQYLTLASAHAAMGRNEEARDAIAQAVRRWPFATVRGYWNGSRPSPQFAAQLVRVEAELRSAGLRDHADENTETGLQPQAGLRADLIGPTPGTVPGAHTIRTSGLVEALAAQPPLIIDTAGTGRSIQGAIGLLGSGSGGGLDDPLQVRLHRKIDSLTRGKHDASIVTLDWNAERWGGYNLALRLAALGYTRVSWYRGGQESWQTNGCPTADLVADDW